GQVGPEATLASSPAFVSEMINVMNCDCGACAESFPPFTAENALRTVFTSSIVAPHEINRRLASLKSFSEMLASTGDSNIAEPPPEMAQITVAFSTLALSIID